MVCWGIEKVTYGDGTALDAADAHLAAADPVMAGLVARLGPVDENLNVLVDDPYGGLLLAITSQQLSTRSARAIYGRLTARYGGRPPTPEEFLADESEEWRTSIGMSHAKMRSLHSLAEHILDGRLDMTTLAGLDDAAVTEALVSVTGIGQWTADVFLIFTLHRQDVLARGDLGIRMAVRRQYGLGAMPSPSALTALGESWRPYRTRGCLYLWRSL